MCPVRWKESDLRHDADLLLHEADSRAAVQGPQGDDPGADRPAEGVRTSPPGARVRGGRFRLRAQFPAERDILPGVLIALNMHPRVALAWRQNTGAGKFQYPDGTTSQWIRFGPKGLPDLQGYLCDGTALYVECKRPGGKLRPEQREWIDRARSCGCVAFVAYGIDDVKEHLG